MIKGQWIRTKEFRDKLSLIAKREKSNLGRFIQGRKPWNTGKGKNPCWCDECKRKIKKFWEIMNIDKRKNIYNKNRREKLLRIRGGVLKRSGYPKGHRKCSLETKERIRLASIGKKLSDETRRKISVSKKGKGYPNILGKPRPCIWKEKHWNWQGGKTEESDKLRMSLSFKNWRRDVFIRDNRTCQTCGYQGSKINAHHIKPFSLYPDLRFDINNGITLCVPCHKQTDSYGYKFFRTYLGGKR